MKIGATNSGDLDLNDGVPKVDDFRIGNIFDPDLSLAIPTDCSHRKTLLKVFSETLHCRNRSMRCQLGAGRSFSRLRLAARSAGHVSNRGANADRLCQPRFTRVPSEVAGPGKARAIVLSAALREWETGH